MKKLITIPMALLLLAQGGCRDEKQPDHAYLNAEETLLLPETASKRVKPLPGVRQEGTNWVDTEGRRLQLRGTNLGNWLLMEFWMMNSPFSSKGEPIRDQCTLEKELIDRFGLAEKNRLMRAYYDSWITERDWDNMQAMGFNLVRVPFLYNIIEDESKPYHLRPDAWVYLDRAIDEAEKRGMYTILDLHGAAGSQGMEQHSGCEGKNQFWKEPDYRNRTQWLWKEIARRYKNRSAVAGYGLLNEPWGTDPQTLAQSMAELYQAIRTIDTDHVIILPGHHSGIDAYTDLSRGMRNFAFEMHFYPGLWGWHENEGLDAHRKWLFCQSTDGLPQTCEWKKRLESLNAAFLLGEFQPWTLLGELGPAVTRIHYDVYNSMGWAATSWSYKTVSQKGSEPSQGWGWGMASNHSAGGRFEAFDIGIAHQSEIEAYFRQFATQPLFVNEGLKAALTAKLEVGRRIEAEHFTYHEGASVEASSDAGGGLNVAYLDDRDWMNYPLHVPAPGVYSVELRVASPSHGGKVILGQDGKDLAVLEVPHTGGWQQWRTIQTQIFVERAGQQSFTLWVEKGGWNLNWWSMKKIF